MRPQRLEGKIQVATGMQLVVFPHAPLPHASLSLSSLCHNTNSVACAQVANSFRR